METNYGIGISNRYNLFLDEDTDPLEILKLQEQEKVATKEKPAKVVKDIKGKGTTSTKPGLKKSDDKKGPRAAQGLSEQNRGSTGDAKRTEVVRRDDRKPGERTGPPPARFDREFGDRDESGRGGGRGGGFRGRGLGRGGGRGRGFSGELTDRGFDMRGKRDYDRHSGTNKTGIKAVEKRDGGGSHNWGRATDGFESVEWRGNEENLNATHENVVSEIIEEIEKETQEESKEPAKEGDEAANEETKEPEPVEKQFTLDEWKAMQEEKRNRPNFKIRRAGEGEDPKQWKNTVVLKKKVPLSDEEDEEYEYEEEEEEHQPVEIIPIVFSSGPARRGGRGRGGPGRGGFGRDEGQGMRGGRGRGGFGRDDGPPPGREQRGGRREPVQSAPKVDDENDFPSL